MGLTTHRSLIAAVAAAAAFAVAGCGDDDEDTDTAAQDTATDTATEETETQAAGESAVTISATDFEFDPSDPTIEEDGQVEIEMTNDGEFPHAVAIDETGDSSDTVEGGESATLSANLDSGEYTIFCPVGDHRQQGMEGTLTVGGGNGGDDDGGGGGGDDSGGGDDDDSGGDDDGSGGGGY